MSGERGCDEGPVVGESGGRGSCQGVDIGRSREPLELTGKNVSVTLTAAAGQKVTAVYTGNALFTGSTREVTID